MRRFLAAFALSLLAFAAMAGGANSESPSARLHVGLGDSLGVGTGASVESKTGYVPRLFHAAHAAPLGGVSELSNLSEGGETSGTFLSDGQLAAALAAISDPSTDTALVSLGIGGDDLLPLLKHPDCANPASVACQLLVAGALQGFATNFPTIVGSLQATLASDPAPLLVMTYYNPFSGTGSVFEGPVDAALLGADGVIDCTQLGVPANVGLNDLIACIAVGAGATVVDVYPEFAGRGALLTHIDEFDIHPNTAGYAVIAKAFGDALR